jgi:pimeloyl-ACP methyl ester carboxylesterase
VLVVHGRGWAPDFELYGALRTQIAEAGWSTLSIQMPVLAGTAKLGDYVDIYPDAIERIKLAVDWLHAKDFERVAIVSHSLGATMANQYLIRASDGKVGAWVFLSILNGLEDMFRLRIPVLDLFADGDWEVIRVGADERRKQIERIRGSRQVMVRNSDHFYEDHRPEVVALVVDFLDQAFTAR